MNVLAFDCTTRFCSAAIVDETRLLARRGAAMERGQAEALLPMIEGVLADAGLRWAEIGLVGVTVGPGTFTGIRIGLAAARGMALAGGMEVAGVLTTEAMALGVPASEREGRTLVTVVDGRRADLFVQGFDAGLEPLGDPVTAMPDEIAALFPGPVLLAGDGARRAFAHVPGAVLSSRDGPADAALVARLALSRHAGGRALLPRPLYLRPADVTMPGTRT